MVIDEYPSSNLWDCLPCSHVKSALFDRLNSESCLLPLNHELCLLHCRYDMASNRWWEESHVPREAPRNSSFGFVALDGELHVITLKKAVESADSRRSRQHNKKTGILSIQIYNLKRKTWRSLITKSPFHEPLNFNTAVMCGIRL